MTLSTYRKLNSVCAAVSVVSFWLGLISMMVLVFIGNFKLAVLALFVALIPYFFLYNTIFRGYLYDYWNIESLLREERESREHNEEFEQ